MLRKFGSGVRKKLLCEVEKVRELMYLGNRVRAGEWREVGVTSMTTCDWVKYMKCGELSRGIMYMRLNLIFVIAIIDWQILIIST